MRICLKTKREKKKNCPIEEEEINNKKEAENEQKPQALSTRTLLYA